MLFFIFVFYFVFTLRTTVLKKQEDIKMALFPRQPNEYPDYYVVKDPTFYSGNSSQKQDDDRYWLGHYGRNGVYTSQQSIDDHNARVSRARNGF
jgi:hypothetical protein